MWQWPPGVVVTRRVTTGDSTGFPGRWSVGFPLPATLQWFVLLLCVHLHGHRLSSAPGTPKYRHLLTSSAPSLTSQHALLISCPLASPASWLPFTPAFAHAVLPPNSLSRQRRPCSVWPRPSISPPLPRLPCRALYRKTRRIWTLQLARLVSIFALSAPCLGNSSLPPFLFLLGRCPLLFQAWA